MSTEFFTTDVTDNYEVWIEAVGAAVENYPDELTMNDLLAAYALMGVKTTLTEEQVDAGIWHLETYGFVDRAGCALTVPSKILTEAELED